MLDADQMPKWLRQEITDSTEADYSVFQPLDDEVVAVLAAVGVHQMCIRDRFWTETLF